MWKSAVTFVCRLQANKAYIFVIYNVTQIKMSIVYYDFSFLHTIEKLFVNVTYMC